MNFKSSSSVVLAAAAGLILGTASVAAVPAGPASKPGVALSGTSVQGNLVAAGRGRGHRGHRARHRARHRRHHRRHHRRAHWRHHGKFRKWRRHIRRHRLHRGRFHHRFWRRGPIFGTWFGYPLYLYNYAGYDCHQVEVYDDWEGRYALIGGTLCYDELGYPYLQKRWFISWADDPGEDEGS